MTQIPYPTGEHNFVVNPLELGLQPSREPDYRNNHHLYWPYKQMGQFLITRSFRDLAMNQLELPVDQHNELHRIYGPPTHLPALADMVEVLEAAHDLGEPLRVQENRRGPYFYHRLSSVALKQCHMEYNRLNQHKKAA